MKTDESFAKFLESVVSSNPNMKDEDASMKITVASLKKQMKRAYEAGCSDGESFMKAVNTLNRKSEQFSFGDMFNFWGKK